MATSSEPTQQPRSNARVVAMAWMLAAAAGGVDAIGWHLFDGLFIAHMSGNVIAAMALIALGQDGQIARRFITIAGFALGLTGGAVVEARSTRSGRLDGGLVPTLAAEAILLSGLVLVAWRMAPGGIVPATPRIPYVVLPAVGALIMGLQTVTVRRIGRTRARTTFITGTLTRGVEELVSWLAERLGRSRTDMNRSAAPRRRIVLHIGVLGSYAAGGVVSAMIGRSLGAAALVLPLGAVLASLVNARHLALTSAEADVQ